MTNLTQTANKYLDLGLSVIPTKEDKTPTVAWAKYQREKLTQPEADRVFSGASGIAIVTGGVSGGLEVIDVDTKYDLTGKLWEELSSTLQENLPGSYSELLIAQTKSGGYHLYYKAPEVEGNAKLASRTTTEQEREQTYTKEIEKGATEEQARARANNDKTRVLIETRGEGGYIIAPPTKGYTYLQGSPEQIPALTPAQRLRLLRIARSFSEISEEKTSSPETPQADYTGISPFEDYNSRADIVGLLVEKGWSVVSETQERVNLLRPGETDSKTSGNFHKGKRLLRVFSSSTEFNPDRAYNPSQVFSLLECNEDNKQAYRELLRLGYGTPPSGATRLSTQKIQVTGVNPVNRETSVICSPGDLLIGEQAKGYKEVIITSPQGGTAEALGAIELLYKEGKRVYIKDPDLDSPIAGYLYQLKQLLRRYEAQQDKAEGLTDREIDRLLEEIVEIGSQIPDPVSRDRYNKEVTTLEALQELGVTDQSLEVAIDRVRSTKEKEEQDKELDKLLLRAHGLRDKGETGKALQTLQDNLTSIKLKSKETEFSKLLIKPTEEGIRERLSKKKASLDSGYMIGDTEFLLPAGALTVLAGPTSHGKTTLLLNLMLNVAERNPDKQFYFFSYEEDADAITVKALNISLDTKLSRNNRRTIQSYYKEGTEDYIEKTSREAFRTGKDKFYTETLQRINIVATDYDSDSLIEAIHYLSKELGDSLGGIFIDYFQLLNLPESRLKNYGSRQTELKEICQNLNRVAKETGLPFILGAQFNREVTSPLEIHATRVGEAGDIERIVNVLIGLWDTKYPPKLDPSQKKLNEVLEEKGIRLGHPGGKLFIQVLKNRDGETGAEDQLLYNGNTGKISNPENAGGF